MKNVLVIEDNYDNFRLINYALKRYGYEVIHAKTGEEGVEVARQENLRFIIMDINLPGIDGFETIKLIRKIKEHENTPIIAITSFAMADDRERIIAAGCNGYFEKPIDPLNIVESIHKTLKF